jgi:hypothetical protein
MAAPGRERATGGATPEVPYK